MPSRDGSACLTEAAEDAVQESLMRLWMTIAAGDQIAKPDSWSCLERIGAEPRRQ